MSAPECLDCPVRDSAVCSALSHEARDRLARLGRRRHYVRGETIFAAGDEEIACASLISGAVKLSRFDTEGVERTVALIHPAGFLARLFATPADCTATALAPTELCLFPRAAVLSEMREHPDFMERVLRATTDQLDQSRALIELIGRRDARARVAGFLKLLANDGCAQPQDGLTVDLALTRGEMASLLGLTIETVSRQLGALEADGVIERVGLKAAVVPSIARLQAEAG